jgi:hypothetical protein
LFDLLDGEIAVLGRDPNVGSISNAQPVHHELRGLTQRVEMPLVAVPIRSSLRNSIGWYPMHINRAIKFHPMWWVESLELGLQLPTPFGSIEEAKQDLKFAG